MRHQSIQMMKHRAADLQWSQMLTCSAPTASTYCLAPSVLLVSVVHRKKKSMNKSALETASYLFKKIFSDFWTKLQHTFFVAADSQQLMPARRWWLCISCISSSYLAQILRAQWPWKQHSWSSAIWANAKPHFTRQVTWIRRNVTVHQQHFMDIIISYHITIMLWC